MFTANLSDARVIASSTAVTVEACANAGKRGKKCAVIDIVFPLEIDRESKVRSTFDRLAALSTFDAVANETQAMKQDASAYNTAIFLYSEKRGIDVDPIHTTLKINYSLDGSNYFVESTMSEFRVVRRQSDLSDDYVVCSSNAKSAKKIYAYIQQNYGSICRMTIRQWTEALRSIEANYWTK